MDASAIVGRIDALIKERGISKQDFYQACKISSAAFSQWNTGKTTPRTSSLRRIAEYLQTSYEYLTTGLEENKKAPTREGEHEINMDDFTYAMQNESKVLTVSDKQLLLSMARQLGEARKKENGEND